MLQSNSSNPETFRVCSNEPFFLTVFPIPKKTAGKIRGKESKTNNIVHYEKKHLTGTLHCFQCLNFSANVLADLNFYLAKEPKRIQKIDQMVKTSIFCDKRFTHQ